MLSGEFFSNSVEVGQQQEEKEEKTFGLIEPSLKEYMLHVMWIFHSALISFFNRSKLEVKSLSASATTWISIPLTTSLLAPMRRFDKIFSFSFSFSSALLLCFRSLRSFNKRICLCLCIIIFLFFIMHIHFVYATWCEDIAFCTNVGAIFITIIFIT